MILLKKNEFFLLELSQNDTFNDGNNVRTLSPDLRVGIFKIWKVCKWNQWGLIYKQTEELIIVLGLRIVVGRQNTNKKTIFKEYNKLECIKLKIERYSNF